MNLRRENWFQKTFEHIGVGNRCRGDVDFAIFHIGLALLPKIRWSFGLRDLTLGRR